MATSSPQAAPGGTPPPAAPDYKALSEAAERKAAALEEKVKAGERERLDRLKADKKREADEADRRRDPVKHFREVLGDDWYDIATKAKAGTVTPAGVSTSLADVEQRMEARWAEREKALRSELAEVKARDNERQRQEYLSEASQHAKSNPDKYPLLHKFKQLDDVGGFIDGHFQQTSRRDAEGNFIPGELWTPEVAAQKLEEYWAGVKEMVLKAESGRATEAPARLTIVPPQGDGRTAAETPEERNARLDRVFSEAQAGWKKRISGQRN